MIVFLLSLLLSCGSTEPESDAIQFNIDVPSTIKVGTSVKITGNILIQDGLLEDTVALIVFHDSLGSFSFVPCVDILHYRRSVAIGVETDTFGLSQAKIDTFPLAMLPGLSLGLRMSNYLHYPGTNKIVIGTDVEYGIVVGDSAKPGNYCIVFNIKMRDEEDYYRSIKEFSVIR